MFGWQQEQEEDHIATGSESLREFAFNAGMDNPDQCWLLDSRDVWVRNPHYRGPDVTHPEDDCYPEDEPRTVSVAEAQLVAYEQARQDEVPF